MIWDTPALDPELGLVYFATGNCGPDYDGSVREGDNLFCASIVALKAKIGEYVWHFQQVHHGMWDYDAAPVVLFDTTINGQPRKALGEAGHTPFVGVADKLAQRCRREIAVLVVDCLDPRAVDRQQFPAEQVELPAQQHKFAKHRSEGRAVVAPEVGDGLEVGRQVLQQPDHFEVATGLRLQPPARPHPVQIAVDESFSRSQGA